MMVERDGTAKKNWKSWYCAFMICGKLFFSPPFAPEGTLNDGAWWLAQPVVAQAIVFSTAILFWLMLCPGSCLWASLWRGYVESGLIGALCGSMWVVLGHLIVTEKFQLCGFEPTLLRSLRCGAGTLITLPLPPHLLNPSGKPTA